MIIICTTIIVLAVVFAVTSVKNTNLRTEATVAKAQEHTKRVENRQNTIDVLGFFRGWKDK